jgi:shikimate kinase
MRVVYLYGPPGVGKLTVGTELAALTGFRLFHNHLTVNLATAIFPRESPAWVRMIRHVRRHVFAEVMREGVDLIYTGVYLGTVEQATAIETMLEPIRAGGGSVAFVQLACEREDLVRRVQNESRRRHDKLTDPRVLLERYDLTATVPFAPHLRLDTTHLSPADAAARIAAHYDLPAA